MDIGLYVQNKDACLFNGLVVPIYWKLLLSTLYTATFTREGDRKKMNNFFTERNILSKLQYNCSILKEILTTTIEPLPIKLHVNR